MTKLEISGWLAIANVVLGMDKDLQNDEMIIKMRQALGEAQVILTDAAVKELQQEYDNSNK